MISVFRKVAVASSLLTCMQIAPLEALKLSAISVSETDEDMHHLQMLTKEVNDIFFPASLGFWNSLTDNFIAAPGDIGTLRNPEDLLEFNELKSDFPKQFSDGAYAKCSKKACEYLVVKMGLNLVLAHDFLNGYYESIGEDAKSGIRELRQQELKDNYGIDPRELTPKIARDIIGGSVREIRDELYERFEILRKGFGFQLAVLRL